MVDIDFVKKDLVELVGKDAPYAELLKAAYSKYSTRQISDMLLVSPSWVQQQLKLHGVSRRSKGGANNISRLIIAKDEWEQLSAVDLSKKYNCHRTYVYTRAKKLGYLPKQRSKDMAQVTFYDVIESKPYCWIERLKNTKGKKLERYYDQEPIVYQKTGASSSRCSEYASDAYMQWRQENPDAPSPEPTAWIQ